MASPFGHLSGSRFFVKSNEVDGGDMGLFDKCFMMQLTMSLVKFYFVVGKELGLDAFFH
jgi:hypothetical protein